MTFEELNLSAPLLRAVQEAGYETPSPIQAAAIPPVLSGRDLMGCAQTGTGKTAAFALPMLDRRPVGENARIHGDVAHLGAVARGSVALGGVGGGIADGLVGEGHRVAGDKRQIAALSVVIVVDGGDAVIAGDGCHHRAVFHDLGDGGLVRRADQIGRDDDAVFVGVAVCLRYHGVAALLHDPLGSLGQQG